MCSSKCVKKGSWGIARSGREKPPDRARDGFENNCFGEDTRWRWARSPDQASSRITTVRVSPGRVRNETWKLVIRADGVRPDRAGPR